MFLKKTLVAVKPIDFWRRLGDSIRKCGPQKDKNERNKRRAAAVLSCVKPHLSPLRILVYSGRPAVVVGFIDSLQLWRAPWLYRALTAGERANEGFPDVARNETPRRCCVARAPQRPPNGRSLYSGTVLITRKLKRSSGDKTNARGKKKKKKPVTDGHERHAGRRLQHGVGYR